MGFSSQKNVVIPLGGFGGGWEGLGGGRHKPKQGGTSREPDEVRRINTISLLGIHSFEFLAFEETSGHLSPGKVASSSPSPSKQRRRTLQLVFFQGKKGTSLAVRCCPSALSATPGRRVWW